MDRNQRVALLALAAVVLVVGFFVARSSDDDDARQQGSVTAVTAAGSAPTGDGHDRTAATTAAPTQTATAPSERQEPAFPTVRVVDGEPIGGVRKLSFEKGDRVDFKVSLDEGAEVHVHGYDVRKTGEEVRFTFPADIDGRFEVELEGVHVQIAQLEVTP